MLETTHFRVNFTHHAGKERAECDERRYSCGIRVTPVHLTKITSLSEIGRHMVRKIAATLALAAVGLMMAPSLAFAYPAPPVTPNAWTAPATTVSSNIELASTGAGFSVETAVLIGAVVLLVGVLLLVVGNRLRRASSHR